MKLDPAGVEKAAKAIHETDWQESSDAHWRNHPSEHWPYIERATAALTAYFDHLKVEGLMREAAGYSYRDEWEVGTARTVKIPSDFKAAIIRTDKD